MAASKYALVVDGTKVPIYIVATLAFGGGDQTVVQYESPGSNGGSTITTGRTAESITLSGKMIAAGNITLSELKNYWQGVRDKGNSVRLFSPLDDGRSGRYIVKSFTGSLGEGQGRFFEFTMILEEFRQANIQRSKVNLVNFAPAEEAKQVIADRNIGTG